MSRSLPRRARAFSVSLAALLSLVGLAGCEAKPAPSAAAAAVPSSLTGSGAETGHDHGHDHGHVHGSDADHGHEHAADERHHPPGEAIPSGHAAGAAAAAYACPMHPEVTSAGPAKCRKCGMDLVSAAPAVPPAVKVTMSPGRPKAGVQSRLVIEMEADGARLDAFDVVHDKKLHLLMVTPDLAWFAHEHPEPRPDGTFALDFTFPHGGTFRVFADFKATGRAPAVVPVDVMVEGAAPAPTKLTPTDLARPRVVGAYAVRMTTPPPAAGGSATLKFLVARDGKPVTDLSPYLGALGHLVILNEDGKTFLHSHPEETGPHDDSGQAPHTHTAVAPGEVAFGTRFPKPGLYKAWAQFLHAGTMIVADFVVDIR